MSSQCALLVPGVLGATLLCQATAGPFSSPPGSHLTQEAKGAEIRWAAWRLIGKTCCSYGH